MIFATRRSRAVAIAVAAVLLTSCRTGAPPADRSPLVDLTRAEWGAADPVGEMARHTPDRITIHHTASRRNPNRSAAEKLRALQRFSQTESPLADGRMKPPWPDVPYHFYIADDGTVAEARDVRYAGDSNTPYDPSGHLLIVVEGNFQEESPSPEQMRSLERLVVRLADRWNVPADRLASHRDFAATACPGDSLYSELPRLRRLIREPVDSVSLRAVVISDLNESYGVADYSPEVRETVDRIVNEWRPDVVIAAGDLIAGQQPDLPDSRVREMWQAFDSIVARPLRDAGIPLIATLGNHDASAYPAHERDRRLAVEHWLGEGLLPEGVVDGRRFPLRYTARIGGVFFAVWDGTNQESSRDPALLEWLERALGSPEAATADHRLVVSHLPLYPVAIGRDRPGEFLVNGDSLRRALESLGATMFVSGHHHAYYPGRRGGLRLLHTAALGGGPRPLVGGGEPRKGMAILDFSPDSVRLAAYEVSAGDGVRSIAIDTLPPIICSGRHWVGRWDLPEPAEPCEAASDTASVGGGRP